MAEAVVEHDYTAHEPDELTIKKGDIITDISFKSGGWWEGTLTRGSSTKRGMFPDNFVKLISDPEGKASASQSGRRCKVLFKYKPANDDELELQVGDMIDIISEVEEGWWRGKLKNRVGVFPSNFVAEIFDKDIKESAHRKHRLSHDETSKTVVQTQEHKEHSSASSTHSSMTITKATSESSVHDLPLLPPKPVKELCKAIFDYEAANSDELTLQEGDVITLITKEGQDPGWWKGELKGKIGVFPDNFVQVITSSEEVAKPDRPSKTVSSTKIRDTISKSATATSITSISRKFSDTPSVSKTEGDPSPLQREPRWINQKDIKEADPSPSLREPRWINQKEIKDEPKQEDKTTVHPSVSKKPLLPPPPMKKPQRSSSDLAKSPTAPNLLSSKMLDISPTSQGAMKTASSKVTTSVKHTNSVSENTNNVTSTLTNKWSVMETSADSADGALWSRHGSYSLSAAENNFSSSHSGTITTEPDLDMVSRAAMLTHPTASRVKAPKRRPPSTIITTKDEMKNEEEEEDEGIEIANVVTSSTTTISHSSTMISSSMSSSSSVRTSTTMVNGDADSHGDKPKAPWVKELEFNQAKKSLQAGKTRVIIGGGIDTIPTTAPAATSSTTTTVSTESKTTGPPTVAGVTLRSHPSSGAPSQRPQSMVGSLRSALMAGASSEQNTTLTITVKQFNELFEKVARLDLLESQIGALTKTVKELSGKLDEERLRRAVMQQELEKLTDLVTQV